MNRLYFGDNLQWLRDRDQTTIAALAAAAIAKVKRASIAHKIALKNAPARRDFH